MNYIELLDEYLCRNKNENIFGISSKLYNNQWRIRNWKRGSKANIDDIEVLLKYIGYSLEIRNATADNTIKILAERQSDYKIDSNFDKLDENLMVNIITFI